MLGTGGRSMPAWSDLTGAPASNGFGANGSANGSNGSAGANGFYGPRSNEVIPPLPSGPSGQPSAPQGFAGLDNLPQRRNNGETFRPDTEPNGYGGTIPRQLPANPENQGRGTFVPPVSAPPLPPVSAPPMPSVSPYGGRPVSAPPMSGPPMSGPPMSASPTTNQAGSAPPAWPPVASDRDQGAAPHVPESLAAALDMTAEIPRYRPERSDQRPQVERPVNPQTAPIPSSAPPAPVSAVPVSSMPASGAPQTDSQRAAAAARAAHEVAAAQAAEAQATAAAQIAAAQAAARQRENGSAQFADETMELPIFRELESAWFTTGHPADAPKAPAPSALDDGVTPQRYPTGEPARSVGVPHQAASPESRDFDPTPVGASVSNGAASNGAASNGAASNGAANGSNGTAPNGSNGTGNPWRTAADEGWQAARAAAETPVDSTTTAGLPKRTPMAQLVPGGVDRGGNSVQRRTPEGVRGLLSAYHRGVQRGRTQEESTNPGETPGGQQSSQAGKEHEA
jgi:hypothetical protein